MSYLRLLVAVACCSAFGQTARHPLRLDDLDRIRDVRDPQCSPDGQWVAYVLGTTDAKDDKRDSDIWMVSYDGKTNLRLTSSPESESSPRWSPDGKFLAFLSSRPGKAKGNQVWLLDRQGGEAVQLTDVKGRLQGYEWSPDSKRLALVIGDPDPEAEGGAEGGKPKTPKPIVIDRYKYKQDGAGYLTADRHSYIYLFDVATKKLERLTAGKVDEAAPSWSPDGMHIAYMSNHAKNADRDHYSQVYVAEAKTGAAEKQLSPLSMPAERGRPEWSPDGKWIAFQVGEGNQYEEYAMAHLAVVPADGSMTPTLVKATEALDRGVGSPRFSADGASLTFLVTDDRSVYPAVAKVTGGSAERLMSSPIVVTNPSVAKSCSVVVSGGDSRPGEIFAMEGGKLRQLTHQNDALVAEWEIPPTEELSFKSKDGTEIHGLLTRPVGYTAGTKVPLLLRIHGGPNGQDAHSFSTERQIFAANGYAVLAVNYRGGSGRGQKYSHAIFADWGRLEVEDLEAGVNHVIEMGVADPERLGVGGWSYGAILTDYMIATDTRFKAATSGAGTGFALSFYGTDQYIIQYDYEIGPPWKSLDTYLKIAYPFLHADRIKTPTLFLGGEKDFNVPVQGSQQMYQALRSLGVDTQLIIYPNENHGIQRPSYQRDRNERYLAWYDKYLKKRP
ncbi:MAG TPA: S9 family peptidase [Candidatus Sulfopaludibacter sp.]|jgi:dipeptidyl aminopeptidase/acylaminoacyl peptidase|nr:S9 family peptidase [Candidatus Sulfopaludibacter sp.]